MNLKVNGITSMKQLQQLDGLNVDFAGLIFHKESPGYIADRLSKKDIGSADMDIKTVGIFVNAEYDEVMKTVEAYGLDIVQLHGEESPHLCEQVSNKIEVIKTFSIDNKSDKSIDYMLKEYDEVCDYYLFNKASGKPGAGTGEKFDWKIISGNHIEKPFFLSGGIKPGDGLLIKKFKHPDFYGVDINTHFEKEPGVKDMAAILQLIQGLK